MCREPSVLTSWPCAGRARVWLQQASGGAEVGSLGYGFPYCSQPVSSAVGVLPGGQSGNRGLVGRGTLLPLPPRGQLGWGGARGHLLFSPCRSVFLDLLSSVQSQFWAAASITVSGL